jgi:hypothetical protein
VLRRRTLSSDRFRTEWECGVTNTVIDLGEVQREQPEPVVTARPPVPWRALLGVLSLVLIAALAGAAPQLPPRPPTVIPARLADATFIDDGRLFVVSAGPRLADQAVQNKLVSAYALPGGRLLSQTVVAVLGPVSNVLQAGDTIVVSYQTDAGGSQATVALTAGSDEALWRRSNGLVGASGPAGIALISSGYGAQNEAVFSAVDLRTGDIRWSVRQPADGYTMVSGPDGQYPRWFVTVRSNGLLETRDARTGRPLSTHRGPPLDPNTNSVISAVGNMALIGGQTGGVTAYALPGLNPIWHTDVDLSETWMRNDCGPVLCAFRPQQGMVVLDPADGHLLWSSGRWAFAEPAGNYLVVAPLNRGLDDPSYWVLDPRTGRVLGDFGNWDMAASDTVPDQLYGVYTVPGQNVIFYGVLDPDQRRVQILGSGSQVSGNCQTSVGALVCRLVDASVAIWRLR